MKSDVYSKKLIAALATGDDRRVIELAKRWDIEKAESANMVVVISNMACYVRDKYRQEVKDIADANSGDRTWVAPPLPLIIDDDWHTFVHSMGLRHMIRPVKDQPEAEGDANHD